MAFGVVQALAETTLIFVAPHKDVLEG